MKNKGVSLPIICPMCNIDIEHLLHLFFYCQYASSCWHSVGLVYDMREVYSAPEWVLSKLECAKHEEIVTICVLLWGIWFWRNKRVWKNQLMNPAIAMENSLNYLKQWREARSAPKQRNKDVRTRIKDVIKWKPPESGELKVNVDASFFAGEETFSVGLVLRDHEGTFVKGKCLTLPCPSTVFEAESIGVREALSWVIEFPDKKVVIETDSLLTARAVNESDENFLELDHIIEHCKMLLKSLSVVRVSHIRKQANRVAHSLARLPCFLNCFIVFSSPPTHLVEILLSDSSN